MVVCVDGWVRERETASARTHSGMIDTRDGISSDNENTMTIMMITIGGLGHEEQEKDKNREH